MTTAAPRPTGVHRVMPYIRIIEGRSLVQERLCAPWDRGGAQLPREHRVVRPLSELRHRDGYRLPHRLQ